MFRTVWALACVLPYDFNDVTHNDLTNTPRNVNRLMIKIKLLKITLVLCKP